MRRTIRDGCFFRREEKQTSMSRRKVLFPELLSAGLFSGW
jgi:hypothetical protein